MFGGIPKSEIDELCEYWKAFPNLKQTLFNDNGTPYVTLAANDIKSQIKNHADVIEFEKAFGDTFANFSDFLKDELLSKMTTLAITKTEDDLSENIFDRLRNIPLIDRYEAYQILDDNWSGISVDLEIIETEGFEAAKKG